MTNDRKLSPHFSLFDLTRTDHADLQEENRHVTTEEQNKLTAVAELLEQVLIICGFDVIVTSGRRFLELNKRVGGSDRSQHLKCEAADLVPAHDQSEEAVVELWQKIATAARAGRIKFGQLIVEAAPNGREGGKKCWVHISLGAPYRAKERCGEVLTMKDGKFSLISQIKEAV